MKTDLITTEPVELTPGWVNFPALPKAEQVYRANLITVKARAILQRFWRDASEPYDFQIFELETWIGVLRSINPNEIDAAWIEYNKTGPRTKDGKLYRPDPGAIYHLVMKARAIERKRQWLVENAAEIARRAEIDRQMMGDLKDEWE